jgi:hypothetical protein
MAFGGLQRTAFLTEDEPSCEVLVNDAGGVKQSKKTFGWRCVRRTSA